MKHAQSGFTLVEIAIVLVIIGLLLGGILKGQELIVQARIKNVANDLNGISAAVYSYQDRYRMLPGDDNTAGGRWPANAGCAAAAPNGTGNGTLTTGTPDETVLFWQHLRRAGLIGGDACTSDPPLNAAGGRTVVQTGALGLSGLAVCSTGLPARIAAAIDSQFDNGRPDGGAVRGRVSDPATAIPAAAPTTPITAYVDDGATLHDVCKNI